MSDGFYRKTESLIVAVRVAMRELENASMGAVGDNGPSLDEMDLRVARTGLPWEGNADYETMQRAWRILEAGLRDYVSAKTQETPDAYNAPRERTAVADTLEDFVGNSVESIVRAKWNADADEFNQWDSLGQDEKDELIANSALCVKKEAP